VEMLEQAKRLDDVLVVSVTRDALFEKSTLILQNDSYLQKRTINPIFNGHLIHLVFQAIK
jgi:hypothetical protein